MCEDSQSPCAAQHGAVIQIHQMRQFSRLCRTEQPLPPSMAQLVQAAALRGCQRRLNGSVQSFIAEHRHRSQVSLKLRGQIGAGWQSDTDGCGEHILNRAVRSISDAL